MAQTLATEIDILPCAFDQIQNSRNVCNMLQFASLYSTFTGIGSHFTVKCMRTIATAICGFPYSISR